MNKRGFIFTFISITLVSVILLAFLIQNSSRTKVEIERTNIEVETMNAFVKALEEDYLPRTLEISGNQAILSLLQCMDTNFDCHEDIEGVFHDEGYLGQNENQLRNYIINAIVDGRFEHDFGVPDDGIILELMTFEEGDYTLPYLVSQVESLADTTGINLDITDEIESNQFEQQMNVDQTDPFHVRVTMEIDYRVYNDDESISWEFIDKEIEGFIPLYNFREPIYMIERGNNILVEESEWVGEELRNNIIGHIANTDFIGCDQSPSFLDRMMGNTGANPQGIESLIDDQGNQNRLVSAIDFQNIIGPMPDEENLREIEESGYYIDVTHTACYGF